MYTLNLDMLKLIAVNSSIINKIRSIKIQKLTRIKIKMKFNKKQTLKTK